MSLPIAWTRWCAPGVRSRERRRGLPWFPMPDVAQPRVRSQAERDLLKALRMAK